MRAKRESKPIFGFQFFQKKKQKKKRALFKKRMSLNFVAFPPVVVHFSWRMEIDQEGFWEKTEEGEKERKDIELKLLASWRRRDPPSLFFSLLRASLPSISPPILCETLCQYLRVGKRASDLILNYLCYSLDFSLISSHLILKHLEPYFSVKGQDRFSTFLSLSPTLLTHLPGSSSSMSPQCSSTAMSICLSILLSGIESIFDKEEENLQESVPIAFSNALKSIELIDREILSNGKRQTLFLIAQAEFPHLFQPLKERLWRLRDLVNSFVPSTPSSSGPYPHTLKELASKIERVVTHWFQMETNLQKLVFGPLHSLLPSSSHLFSLSTFSSTNCFLLDFLIGLCLAPGPIQQKGVCEAAFLTAFSFLPCHSSSSFLFHLISYSILHFEKVVSLSIPPRPNSLATEEHSGRIHRAHSFLLFSLPSFLVKWVLRCSNTEEAVEVVQACFSSLSHFPKISNATISPPPLPPLFQFSHSPPFEGIPLASSKERSCLKNLSNAFDLYRNPQHQLLPSQMSGTPPSVCNLIFSLVSLTLSNATLIINEILRSLSDPNILAEDTFVPLFSLGQDQSDPSVSVLGWKDGAKTEKIWYDDDEIVVIVDRFLSILQLEGRLLEFTSILFSIFDAIGRSPDRLTLYSHTTLLITYICEKTNIATSSHNQQLIEQAAAHSEWGSLFVRNFLNADIRGSGFVISSRRDQGENTQSWDLFEKTLSELKAFLLPSLYPRSTSDFGGENIYDQFTPHEICLLLSTLWCVLGEEDIEIAGESVRKFGESWRSLVFEIVQHFAFGMVCCVLGFRHFCSLGFQAKNTILMGMDAISNLPPFVLSFTQSIWVPISKSALSPSLPSLPPSFFSPHDSTSPFLFFSNQFSSFSSSSSFIPPSAPSYPPSKLSWSADFQIPPGCYATYGSLLDFPFPDKSLESIFPDAVGGSGKPSHERKEESRNSPNDITLLEQTMFDIFRSVRSLDDSLRILQTIQESMSLPDFCYRMVEFAVWGQESFWNSIQFSEALSPTTIAQLIGVVISFVSGLDGLQFLISNIFLKVVDQCLNNLRKVWLLLNLISAALLSSCFPLCPDRSTEGKENPHKRERGGTKGKTEKLIRNYFEILRLLMKRVQPPFQNRLSVLVHRAICFFEGTGWLAFMDSAQMGVLLNLSVDQSDSVRRLFDWSTFEGRRSCLQFFCDIG